MTAIEDEVAKGVRESICKIHGWRLSKCLREREREREREDAWNKIWSLGVLDDRVGKHHLDRRV
jgi:hypothetical protein